MSITDGAVTSRRSVLVYKPYMRTFFVEICEISEPEQLIESK